jgi:hypothetical protein
LCSFQEHISSNPPNKVVEVDEFLALRKEVRHMLKHDSANETKPDNSDVPPGEDDSSKVISSDEETKAIRERIVSIRRKIHKNTVAAVTARWNFEEGVSTVCRVLVVAINKNDDSLSIVLRRTRSNPDSNEDLARAN